MKGQAEWYETMLSASMKRDWVNGWMLWSWMEHLYPQNQGIHHKDYELYGKPAQDVVNRFYNQLQEKELVYE